jgi:hypothetical protein
VSFQLYDDLRTAQGSLVLTDYLHLLFLCTPYEEERNIDWRHHYYLVSFSPRLIGGVAC